MNHKTLVLLIEDEKSIRNFITTTLQSHNYKIITASNGHDGLSLITSQCPDIILLDLGLPDIDGLEIIRQVRTWANIPIIVLSARTREQEKVIALDAGADDYITKPFGTSELLARMRTALRHSHVIGNESTSFQHTFSVQGLVIDFKKHQILVDSQEVHLTQIEFKILSLLAKNPGRVITYDTIMTNIWGPFSTSNNRILRVNMANIRRKIEKNPAEPQFIFTEIGIGYRMIEDEYN